MNSVTASRKWIRRHLPDELVDRVRNHRVLVWVHTEWKWLKLRRSSHDEVYGEDYFSMVDRTTGQSAGIMAASIVEHLAPTSAIDLGCGTGNLLDELRSLGVSTLGVECAEAALAYCRERDLEVRVNDFTDLDAMTAPLGRFDLAISTEVVQQLPATAAVKYIDYLCHHADTILFSSPPNSSDRRPLTPWTSRRWILEFNKHGFCLDADLSRTFKNTWKEKGTASWFHREPMIFRRATAASSS